MISGDASTTSSSAAAGATQTFTPATLKRRKLTPAEQHEMMAAAMAAAVTAPRSALTQYRQFRAAQVAQLGPQPPAPPHERYQPQEGKQFATMDQLLVSLVSYPAVGSTSVPGRTIMAHTADEVAGHVESLVAARFRHPNNASLATDDLMGALTGSTISDSPLRVPILARNVERFRAVLPTSLPTASHVALFVAADDFAAASPGLITNLVHASAIRYEWKVVVDDADADSPAFAAVPAANKVVAPLRVRPRHVADMEGDSLWARWQQASNSLFRKGDANVGEEEDVPAADKEHDAQGQEPDAIVDLAVASTHLANCPMAVIFSSHPDHATKARKALADSLVIVVTSADELRVLDLALQLRCHVQ